MYIDLVPDEVIWTVNWLHYLNYEPIARTSSTSYLVRTRKDLGQTVTSYGWCNGIPRVVPILRLFSERICVWPSFLPKLRKSSMCRSSLQFVLGTAPHLAVFLMDMIPSTSPIVRTTLMLWYLFFRADIRTTLALCFLVITLCCTLWYRDHW